ncbi:hypothetical protein [Verrucosispora sp. WMMD573]|uniref:hypothetical protein n=1 Tax=Verrucosispora sp. WMMD573 TaxID=3015149 RepID=UPI00248B46CD|nr:hypothetical protein [Verrucosispora sp. WMMD573]WBB54598.1 hypothetical protein O7601_00120 [Verrucosispora sp. WMMD573]
MTTYEAGATVLDILLASAAVALVGCAAWVLIRSRRSATVRLFGRALHHPRLWAAGAACMGFYALLGLGNLTEVMPSTWRTPGRWIEVLLLLAASTLMVTYGILEYRARRRSGPDQQVERGALPRSPS